MLLSPTPAAETVQFLVTAAGRPFDATLQISSVQVALEAEGATASVVIQLSGADTLNSTLSGLQPGVPVGIHAGWGNASQEPLFSGAVAAQVLELEGRVMQVTIQCQSTGPVDKQALPAGPVLRLEYGVDIEALHLTAGAAGAATGSVTHPGSALVVPGCEITLAGLEAVLPGSVVLTSVTHQIAGGSWKTVSQFSDPAAHAKALTAIAPALQAPPAPGFGPDAYGNAILMDATGITLKTSRAIRLQAGQSLQLVSSQDLNAHGLSVTLAADTAFKATGTATAELSAAGQTTVKGALVLIN